MRSLLTSSRIVTPTPRLLFFLALAQPTLTHNHHDMLLFLRSGSLVLLLSFSSIYAFGRPHRCSPSIFFIPHIPFHSPYSFPYSISHTQATRAARSHHTYNMYNASLPYVLPRIVFNAAYIISRVFPLFHILLESLGHSCYPSISTGNAGM